MMQRILGATPEKDKVAHIAKMILVATHKMPQDVTGDDIIQASEQKQFDPYTGGEIQEARSILMTAIAEEKDKKPIATIEAISEERTDVTVKVNHLNLENETEEDKKARKVIEEEIIPALANGLVCVVVLYMPTMEAAKHIVRRSDVISYANAVMKSAEQRFGHIEVTDFAIVEFDLQGTTENNIKIKVDDIRVSQLTK